MKRVICASLFAMALMLSVCILSEDVMAIPTFAKKYQTSCSTCHYAFPKLNGFGKAFLNNGLRFPGDDREASKDEPVSLGADAYKKVFPDAIWPNEIPGLSALSFHLLSRVNMKTTSEAAKEKKSDVTNVSFEFPHEAELLFGGTLGDNLSFFGEVEIEHAAELEYGFDLRYRFKPYLQIRAGNLEHLPIPSGQRLTKTHYNYGNFRIVPGKIEKDSVEGSRWRFRDGQAGLELYGAKNGPNNKGGFTYKVGVVNGQVNDDNDDIDDAKDLYARVTYKIGGLGEIGGATEKPIGASDFYLDDNLRIGGYGYLGKSSYTAGKKSWENSFRVVGGDIDIWFNRLNLFGTVLLQHDNNPKGDDKTSNDALAFFGEADVVIFPWIIGLVRYEWTDTNLDDDKKEPVASVIPGIVVMIRANVKAFLEAQLFLDEDTRKSSGTAITAQFNYGF